MTIMRWVAVMGGCPLSWLLIEEYTTAGVGANISSLKTS
jgi:hypothetical protein